MEKHQEKIASLELTIAERRAQVDALVIELSDLQRQRDEIMQGLSEALRRV